MNETSLHPERNAPLVARLRTGAATAQSAIDNATRLGTGPRTSAAADGADGVILTARAGIHPAARVAAARGLAALALVICEDELELTWTFSGVTIDRAAIVAALDEWNDEDVPVHALIGFDFGAEPLAGRTVRGIATRGIGALVGQEIICWPDDEAARRGAARLVARLANEMLVNGPYDKACRVAGPEDGGPTVLLRPALWKGEAAIELVL